MVVVTMKAVKHYSSASCPAGAHRAAPIRVQAVVFHGVVESHQRKLTRIDRVVFFEASLKHAHQSPAPLYTRASRVQPRRDKSAA